MTLPKLFVAIALLASSPAMAEDVAPAKQFPPASYTLTLTPDDVTMLANVFPNAEYPQAKWGPVFTKIQQQVMKQNDMAAAADAAAAKKPTTPKK